MVKNKSGIADQFKKLQEIIEYLEDDDAMDLDTALEKVKEGSALIKSIEQVLEKAKNEFEEVGK